MQTIYSVNELAERWGLHPSSVRQMENEGKLHRLPDIPGVRFSAAEVLQLESIGKDVEPLTVWERRKLEADNRQLKEENAELKRRLCNIGQLAIGG